jgi:hypothetical protein
MPEFKLRGPVRLRLSSILAIDGNVGVAGLNQLAGDATGRAVGAAALLKGLNLAGGSVASAQATAALLRGLRLTGAAIAGAYSGASLAVSSSATSFVTNIGTDVDSYAGGVGSTPSNPSVLHYGAALLTNEGMFIGANTGDHTETDNHVRGFNPYPVPKNDATGTTRAAFIGWERFPTTMDWQTAASDDNISYYYSQQDNRPQIYIPSENAFVQFGHGGICVYDLTVGYDAGTRPEAGWLYSNRAPIASGTAVWNEYVDGNSSVQYWFGGSSGWYYNAAAIWCPALDVGYLRAGIEASGSGNAEQDKRHFIMARKPGGPQKFSITEVSWPASMPGGQHQLRNCIAAVGPYVYMLAYPGNQLWRLDVRDPTTATQMPGTLSDSGDQPYYYKLMKYDSRRNCLVFVGSSVQRYDLASPTAWVNITPAGFIPHISVYGDYHPDLDGIYFRGGWPETAPSAAASVRWHRIGFETPSAGNRWRQIPMTASNNPFIDTYSADQPDYNAGKHVFWAYHPVKKRIYTWGGDFSCYNSPFSYDGGAGTDAQVNSGASFTTNAPSGAQSYTMDSSYRNDMYSIDPYAAGDATWRLEHPYLPRNLSGSRETRPPTNCQQSLVWDEVRGKFWAIASIVRGYNLYGQDEWATGTLYGPAPNEPSGTWSWTPSANGGAGTWTLESSNAFVAPKSVAGGWNYNGGRLESVYANERLGSWGRNVANDVIVGACSDTQAIVIFKPAGVTYEYRKFPTTLVYSLWDCSTSYVANVDDWCYFIGRVRESVSGKRRSVMVRINVKNALAVANGGNIPETAANFEIYDLPFSLSPGQWLLDDGVTLGHWPLGEWEEAGDNGIFATAKWQEHCGVVAVDRKVVLICSYDGVINTGGPGNFTGTKVAVFDQDTRRFSLCTDAPAQNFSASSWVALPDSGEVLMGITTSPRTSSSGQYPPLPGNNSLWAYRVR